MAPPVDPVAVGPRCCRTPLLSTPGPREGLQLQCTLAQDNERQSNQTGIDGVSNLFLSIHVLQAMALLGAITRHLCMY